MTQSNTNANTFRLVANMEDCLADIDNLLKAVMLMADKLDDTDGALHCVVRIAHQRCRQAEELRGLLHQATHPNRAHFESVGWPV